MADKHLLALEVLREYGVDLSVPGEAEFTIFSLSPIDEKTVNVFASQHGVHGSVDKVDEVFLATLTKRLIITEEAVRPLSEAVERFSQEHGWDYQGWGATSCK